MEKKCILIFDDNAAILSVCKLILEQENYRVATRTSCNQVIQDIISVKPDLVLMDLWIPELGGEHAIQLIKGNPATQKIPVIIFSANTDIVEIQERINANGFLKKPFNIKELPEIISAHI